MPAKWSRTRSVDSSLLKARKKLGTVLVKLMIAGNDMSLANQSQEHWKTIRQDTADARATGALHYFLRLQISHLFEAIMIIDQIATDPFLLRCVEACDARTVSSFNELKLYGKNGCKKDQLQKLAGALRNNIAFHYYQNDKMIDRAIEAAASQGYVGAVRRASHSHEWHFEIADMLAEHIVVRQIWKVDAAENERQGVSDQAKIDEAAMSIHAIFVDFMNFAGEFIWKHSSR